MPSDKLVKGLNSRCAIRPAAVRMPTTTLDAEVGYRARGAAHRLPPRCAVSRVKCHATAQALRGECLRHCNITRHSVKSAHSLRCASFGGPIAARPSGRRNERMVPARRCARPPHGVLQASVTGRARASLAAALRRQSGHKHATDADGNPIISSGSKNLNISIGDSSHADYFQTLRPGSTVTSFDIPSWLDDMIQESAIPQDFYRSNPANQGGLAPKIVDPTTPGRSYELPSPWGQWLQENAVPGSGKVK
jgi:hypothetical protein